MHLPPRRSDWQPRLYTWLNETAQLPHAYGRHDCALFIAGGIDAMHGVDPAAEFRGRYSTYRGGLRVLRQAGIRDPLELLSSSAVQTAPMMAQIGDIAILAGEHPIFGFVTGAQIRAVTPDGAATLPLVIGNTPTASEVWRT